MLMVETLHAEGDGEMENVSDPDDLINLIICFSFPGSGSFSVFLYMRTNIPTTHTTLPTELNH